MKEGIQSVQLVINLLGKLARQAEKNIKLVQSTQPCFRKRREKLLEKSQIKSMFDKIEDILKEKNNAPQPNPTEVINTNGRQDFLAERGAKRQKKKNKNHEQLQKKKNSKTKIFGLSLSRI